MKLLKILLILFVLVIAAGVAAWIFLPQVIVKVITNEEAGMRIIPMEVKKTINEKVESVPFLLDSLQREGVDVTMDDIIKAIDDASIPDITRTIDELNNTELKNEDQVIRIVLKNLDLGKLENEKLVAAAKKKIKMSDVQKGLRFLRDNGKPYALTIPVGKETVKGLLMEKKEKIENDLRKIK